ncbi:MAG: thiamine pyrophosphate-dependent enzyme, partial [Polyangiaceae bacterium]
MQQAKSLVGELDLTADPKLSDEVVLGIFTSLVRLESFAAAERVLENSEDGPARKTVARGEEAALAGALAAARPEDALFPSDVDSAIALARGASMTEVATRTVAWKKCKVTPPSWHNGAHLTHAAGYAWAAKMRHEDVAAIAFSPENVLETGEVHNALNFAGVFKLPVIFVIRASATATAELRGRAQEYGINVMLTDGGDPIATCKSVREARARATSGGGATMIAALIDPNEKRDAASLLRRHLENGKIATREQIEKIIEDGMRQAAASFDGASPQAGHADNLIDNVFATPT